MTTLSTDTFANAETKGLSAQPYLDGSIFMEGAGSKGAKPRPFNYHLAVRQFHHWAYAAATIRANAAAGVPLRMFARRRQGRRKMYETRAVKAPVMHYLAGMSEVKPSRSVAAKMAAWGYEVEEVVEPHPAMTLLQTPNPNDNGYEMAVDRFLDQQITGNHWVYYVESRIGIPTLAYRLPPQWTTVKPNTAKVGENRVAGYVYGKNTANEVVFSEAEVDHFRTANPKDGGLYYGMGWFEACWMALGLHNAKRTEDTSFKDNMSRPDWILSTEGGNKETLERLQSKMKEEFRGTENAGNFLVTLGKITATALQWEPKELGTPTRLIEEIAAASGVFVPILLGNDTNRAGGDNGKLNFYRATVHPDCIRDEQKLNQRYIPRFEGSEDYFLCYDHVSFEDRAELVKENVALVAGGIRSPNEARQYLGDPDAEGADFLYPPAGNTGGSAAAMGNASSQQNDERQDRKGMKAVARMPKVDAANACEKSELQWLRDVYMGFQKDGTTNDLLANQADLGELTELVKVPRWHDAAGKPYMEPFIPVVSQTGPVVDGSVLKDSDGDIVGGGPGQSPPELITITDRETNGKPDAAPAPQGGSGTSPPADPAAGKE